MGRGDTDRAFRAARKHSRYVRILRIAVPAVVVVVLGGFVLWTWLNPMRLLAKLPDNMGDLVISGTKITMEQPRLTGFTRDARPYEVTAKAAAQDLTRPNIVELRELHAKFQMHDQSQTVLTAEDGIYDTKKEVLTLGKNTVIVSSSGYTVWLEHAIVDIRTSNVITEKPVRVKMLQGTLEAERLEVVENGDVLKFDGGVKMLLNLGNSPAAQSTTGGK
jgi:lipopolysaccharide export system protein LptC